MKNNKTPFELVVTNISNEVNISIGPDALCSSDKGLGKEAMWYPESKSISLHRESGRTYEFFRRSKISLEKLSSCEKESPDSIREVALLLHEYGHFLESHGDRPSDATVELLNQEECAWFRGREVAIELNLGSEVLERFDVIQQECLSTYAAAVSQKR